MATALTVNITLLETSPLWISLSQMAAAPLAAIFPTAEDGEANMYDCIPNSSPSMENVIADRLLLDQLFNRLRELDPDADTIIQCWLDDYKISDRAIAEKLGRPQRTFADQMKKIRTELRKVRGH